MNDEKLEIEDWMMTDADVRRLRKHMLPVLEKHNLVEGVRFKLAQRETWEVYLYVPEDLCTWRTMKNRLQRVCKDTGIDPEKVVNSRAWGQPDRVLAGRVYERFVLSNILATGDTARNYISFCDRMMKARKWRSLPQPIVRDEELWRRIDFTDDDGAVYERGVVLPKQNLSASDMAIISLPREFLGYHLDEDGFSEGRDYTPYYAKKLLTRPIKRVKINYGHQGDDASKNLWAIWELDKLEVQLDGSGGCTSPYREDGTLKTSADYGTDLPIRKFFLCGHKILAGTHKNWRP